MRPVWLLCWRLPGIWPSRSDQLSRSIIFLFTTGEEKGLLGSTYYTDHPIVPLYRTSANVNIDGLAIFDEFEDVIGVGEELSSLGAELRKVTNTMDLTVSEIPEDYFIESKSLNRSDQFAFARAGIPSILIVEGLNYKNTLYREGIERMIYWNENIYHTPFDDAVQNINLEAAVQHTNLILEYIIHLADLDTGSEMETWYSVQYCQITFYCGKEMRKDDNVQVYINRDF